MKVTPDFPDHRREDPRRAAELRVYNELANSMAPGQAIYELKATPEAPEVDFGIWLEDVARVGLQVKGGQYTTVNGVWRLHTGIDAEIVTCPSSRPGTPPSASATPSTRSCTARSSSCPYSSSPIWSRTPPSRNGPRMTGSASSGGPKTWSIA